MKTNRKIEHNQIELVILLLNDIDFNIGIPLIVN